MEYSLSWSLEQTLLALVCASASAQVNIIQKICMNPTKMIREALKMSQQQLAQELGISVGSVRRYEGGAALSENTLERLKNLAHNKGYAELALSQPAMGIQQVFEPTDAGKKIRLRRGRGRDMSEELHEALDVILNGGSPDAIGTVDFMLRMVRAAVESMGGPKRGRN